MELELSKNGETGSIADGGKPLKRTLFVAGLGVVHDGLKGQNSGCLIFGLGTGQKPETT